MSEDQDKSSKTEEATEKKIRDSIEKGNTPVSKEMAAFNGLIGMLIIASLFLSDSVTRLSQVLRGFIDQPTDWPMENGADVVSIFSDVWRETTFFLLPIILIFLVAGVSAAVLQNPPKLVGQRIKPELSRLSLIKGWERMFGVKGVVEFSKSFLKLLAVTIVCVVTFQFAYADVINAMFVEPGAVPELTLTLVITMFSGVAIATAGIVGGDILWSRFSWRNDLRMTKQEVKDEHKQVDGDPIVKGRLKSLARARSRQRMIASVPLATLVVANPTHFSIALRYVREENEVPTVIAKGKDIIALKIRKVAEENDIPVIEDKVLARSLYDVVEVNDVIPQAFYKAVAEIIYFISMRNNADIKP